MKAGRAYLAVSLLTSSYIGLFSGALYIKEPELQVCLFLLVLLVGLIALRLAQDDGEARNPSAADAGKEGK